MILRAYTNEYCKIEIIVRDYSSNDMWKFLYNHPLSGGHGGPEQHISPT